ncbi:phage tail assembly protein [Thiotrichales bacterium 19S3-7]|nr:phage tail assembly protein [Thiotrichales bacterium 19S3-7]MCF6802571.1 phage tail assembly protein [Thiotrichales bacterium 19S3-11]
MAIEITLTEQVELCDGKTKTDVITMREPKGSDLLNLSSITSSGLREMTMISHLTTIPLDELKSMNLKDYIRLQSGLVHYQGEDIDPKAYLKECSSLPPKQDGQSVS